MMNCREATRLMSEAQDRKLTLAESAELRIHTLICKGCRNFNQQMQDLRFMMRSYARQADEKDSEQPDNDGKSS